MSPAPPAATLSPVPVDNIGRSTRRCTAKPAEPRLRTEMPNRRAGNTPTALPPRGVRPPTLGLPPESGTRRPPSARPGPLGSGRRCPRAPPHRPGEIRAETGEPRRVQADHRHRVGHDSHLPVTDVYFTPSDLAAGPGQPKLEIVAEAIQGGSAQGRPMHIETIHGTVSARNAARHPRFRFLAALISSSVSGG